MRGWLALPLVISSASSASDELQLHVSFNQTSGTVATDASGHSRDLTLGGDATWAAQDGVLGSGALRLNGASGYAYADNTGWSGTVAFSLWLKSRDTSNVNGVLLAEAGTAGGVRFVCQLYGGIVDFQFWDGGSVPLNARASGKDVGDGFWHHIFLSVDTVGSANNQKIALWVDGVELRDAQGTSGSTSAYATLWVGGVDPAAPHAPSAVFDGLIDELRVYHAVPTGEAIRGLYTLHGQAAGVPLGPLLDELQALRAQVAAMSSAAQSADGCLASSVVDGQCVAKPTTSGMGLTLISSPS